VPAIPGVNRENVTTLRTRADAEALLHRIAPQMNCVVIGGGILGLEAAAALARRGARVALAEGFGWLLPRQLNRTGGEMLARYVRELGIELITDARIKQLDGDEQVRGVMLESGRTLPAELVLVTAGVRSNTFLARLAELNVNDGVIVDNHLRTSDPDIYAVGDVSEHLGVSYGTWAPAQFQGTIAGMNAAGGDLTFAGIPRSNMLKVLGVEMFSIGNVHPDDGSYITYELQEDERYACFIFRDSRLVGAILIGDTSLSAPVKNLVEQQTSCAELLGRVDSAENVIEALNAQT
jgi:nitrite reductase (NADH) large subunit